jgi:hypothetical protein
MPKIKKFNTRSKFKGNQHTKLSVDSINSDV